MLIIQSRTLHKIHTFVEAQQNGSKFKKLLRQGEMSSLLRDCKTGLKDALRFFKASPLNIPMKIY
jgi:hypothetical protein